MEKKIQILSKKELATTVGASLFTTENLVAQFDLVAIGSVVETLIVEVDQKQYEEFLSSSDSEPRRHRRATMKKGEVSSPTGNQKASSLIKTYEASSPVETDKTSSSVKYTALSPVPKFQSQTKSQTKL